MKGKYMFGWLARMMLKTPVMTSGCACCEGKRQRLEKMRKELENGDIENCANNDYTGMNFCSGTHSVSIKSKDAD